jgi:glycosyltransferase involved in cell wall biosynthesis
MKHSISVIIPCYNAEAFLAEAMESVLKQTRPVSEIVVVDDGSTDGSAQVARSYGAKVIALDRNCGHSVARNVAVQAARGDLIAFLDADDYWNPNHCEVVCGLLERNPDAAVAYSATRRFGTRSGVEYESPCDHKPFDAFWESFRACIVSSNNAVMWRSIYVEFGGFDHTIRIASDHEFWFRVSQKHRFVSTPEITSNYRWHPTQISRAPDRQIRSVYKIRYRFLQDARRCGDEELARLVEQKMRAIWDEDIADTWGDPEKLRVLLTLRSLVPGKTPVEPLLWLRGRLPPRVVRRWDRIRQRLGVRTRLARIAARMFKGIPAGRDTVT